MSRLLGYGLMAVVGYPLPSMYSSELPGADPSFSEQIPFLKQTPLSRAFFALFECNMSTNKVCSKSPPTHHPQGTTGSNNA